MSLRSVWLAACGLASLAGAPHAQGRFAAPVKPRVPDVVLVIADDVGWEDLAAVAAAGHAPNLLALGQQGFVFSNLRAAPVCSPSRRMLYTGDFCADQSGQICPAPDGQEPPTTSVLLPEALTRHTTALLGKWHVGGNPFGDWPTVAQDRGFDHWRAGVPWFVSGNGPCGGNGYRFWTRVDDGTHATSLAYQPTAMRQAFEQTWPAMSGPRFVVYAAQLAHSDSNGYHRPPDSLLPGGASYPATPTPRSRYEAMIAALDTQVGQIVAQMDLAEDVLIFVGDNGTPKDVAPDSTRAKTTTFERGVHVPAFLVGAGIPAGSSGALASIADLYATVCGLAGARPPGGLDSRSLLPLVRGTATSVHDHIAYGIRGDPQFGHDDLAVSSLRYKYRRWRTRASDGSTGPWVEELYDLATDPTESVDRSADPALAAELAAHAAFLDAELP